MSKKKKIAKKKPGKPIPGLSEELYRLLQDESTRKPKKPGKRQILKAEQKKAKDFFSVKKKLLASGIHENVTRKTPKGKDGKPLKRKDGRQIYYYVNEEGKRVSFQEWRKFKTWEKENPKPKKKKLKKPVLIQQTDILHKPFLSYLKNRLAENYKIEVLSHTGQKFEFEALGSRKLIDSITAFYYSNINPNDVSPEMFWSPSEDIANKIVYLHEGDNYTNTQENDKLIQLTNFLG